MMYSQGLRLFYSRGLQYLLPRTALRMSVVSQTTTVNVVRRQLI